MCRHEMNLRRRTAAETLTKSNVCDVDVLALCTRCVTFGEIKNKLHKQIFIPELLT